MNARMVAKARWATLVIVVAMLVAPPVAADVPATMTTEGMLHAKGGGPVADGDYTIAFALYAAQSGGTALWSESLKLKVAAGQFHHVLGSVKPIKASVLGAAKQSWIGLTIEKEAELPRTRMHAVAFAMVAATAATAKGLSCTGCVSVKALKFDGDLDLGGKAIKAAKITATDIVAKNVAATSFVGDGSKLTGIKVPSGACSKAGEVVKGINADGSLKCVKAMDPNNLPADGLAKVSNNLLSNQFIDVIAGGTNVPILDNNPTGKSDTLNFPDIGIAQKFEVMVDLSNSDISKLTLNLYDPTNTKHVLYDKGGKGSALKGTWPTSNKLVSGDLGAWVGKNPKGAWRLQPVDLGYKDNKVDGAVKSWSIRIQTLSSKKVESKGVLVASQGVHFKTWGKTPVVCNAAHAGFLYYESKSKTMRYCNGASWESLAGNCGNGVLNPGEQCDDGNRKDGDGCSQLCKTICGDNIQAGGEECDDGNTKDGDTCSSKCVLTVSTSCKTLLKDKPGTKTGTQLIDPDGKGVGKPVKVYCDMSTAGGGWTLVAKVKGNDKTMNRLNTAQWRKKQKIGDCSSMKDENALCDAYSAVPFDSVMIRSIPNASRNLGWKHPKTYKSVWHVVEAGNRIKDGSKLFGSVKNLDYNGNANAHNDCSTLEFGFFSADGTQSTNGIAGHKMAHGHSGGVVGASLFDPAGNRYSHNYGADDGKSTRCVTDFSLGGGYDNAGSNTKNSYAINAHWWGSGNSNSYSWKSHALFVR